MEHYQLRCHGNYQLLERLNVIGRTSEFARLYGIEFENVLSRGTQVIGSHPHTITSSHPHTFTSSHPHTLTVSGGVNATSAGQTSQLHRSITDCSAESAVSYCKDNPPPNILYKHPLMVVGLVSVVECCPIQLQWVFLNLKYPIKFLASFSTEWRLRSVCS